MLYTSRLSTTPPYIVLLPLKHEIPFLIETGQRKKNYFESFCIIGNFCSDYRNSFIYAKFSKTKRLRKKKPWLLKKNFCFDFWVYLM